ncbi:MAG: GAF domain-containing protein, partial [Anaerolineae bacterium]|nr:GAF domain-containing protein [Anaerolineae bacterium]
MPPNTPDLPHGSSTASTHLPVERRSPVFLFILIILTCILAGILISAQQLEAHFFVSWLACAALITLYHLLDDDVRHRFWLWHLLAGLLVAWFTLGLLLALAALGLSLLLATGLWWSSEKLQQLTALSWSEMRHLLLIRGIASLAFLLVVDAVYRLSNGTLPLRTLQNDDLVSVIMIFLVMLGTRFAVSYYFFRTTTQPIITWDSLADGLIFMPAVIILALIPHSLGFVVFWFMIFLISIQTIRSHNARQAQKNHTEFQRKLGVVNAYAPDIMLHGAGHNGLLAVCQAAAAVARIEKAAVYLADTAQGIFLLHTAIGLNPAHKDYLFENVFPIIPRWPAIVQDARQSPDLAAEAEIGGFHSLVNLPIKHDESLLGRLVLYIDQPDYQLGNDLTFLTTLTNYAAKAIENSRTIVELEQYAFETTHLLSLSRALTNLSLDNPENFNYIAATLSQMMDIHWVMLLLWENNAPSSHVLGWIRPDDRDPDERYQTLAQFPEITALEQQSVPRMQPFRQEDPTLSPELAAFMREEGLARLFFVPMQVQTALVGIILLGATGDRVFTAREERLLEVTSSQITAQLQVARLSQMTHRMLNERGQQLSAIEEIARQISGAKNFNEIIHNVLTSAIRTTQADMAALALVTETGDFWVIIQYYDDQGRLQRKYEAQDKDQGVIGRAIRT